jgi:hypothetical protein
MTYSSWATWLQPPTIGEVLPVPQFPIPLDGTLELPQLRADSFQAPGFALAGASVAGSAHTTRGHGAQDAYAFYAGNTPRSVVLAVADGLGSQPLSQLGALAASRLAVTEVAAVASKDLWDEDPSELLGTVINRVNRRLRELRAWALPEADDRIVSTTLALARIDRRDGETVALALRVGDSNVFVLQDSQFRPAFSAKDDATNIVGSCLPSKDELIPEWRVFAADDARAVFAATDGLADDLGESPAVCQWLIDRWAAPCDQIRMLNALSYRRRGSHDDRTAAICWLNPESSSLESRADGALSSFTEASNSISEGVPGQ